MKRALVLGIAVAALAAGCGSTKTVTVTQVTTTVKTVTTTKTVTATNPSATGLCRGADLTGSFDVQPNSAGAGTITYTLTLTNNSNGACTVSGTPGGILLDSNGDALSTHVLAVPADSGNTPVVLQPNAAATADARFSPDVTGTGDAQSGRCQPVAHVFRVTADGGGTVDAPITPPTSVCERGTLSFRSLTAS